MSTNDSSYGPTHDHEWFAMTRSEVLVSGPQPAGEADVSSQAIAPSRSWPQPQVFCTTPVDCGVAIIGANGAGQSTLMRAISGLVLPRSGTVRFNGRVLGSTPANRRVGDGISLVPEGRRVFPSLTVEENLSIGAHLGRKGPWGHAAVY